MARGRERVRTALCAAAMLLGASLPAAAAVIRLDTSTAGADNANPLSYFLSEAELRAAFPGFEDARSFRVDLKYFPLPFLRGWVERRFGFFLTLSARKPGPARAAQTPSTSGSARTSITT